MRLHIGIAAIVERACAFYSQRLGGINVFAATVVAFARVAFRVFVRHYRALRLHDGGGDNIFRSDQLNFVLLAAQLIIDSGLDCRI